MNEIKEVAMSHIVQRWAGKEGVRIAEHDQVTRRNLMISASLALSVLLISPVPTTSAYEINIFGMLKANLDNPIILYIALLGACFYHLKWYKACCRIAMVRDGQDGDHLDREQGRAFYLRELAKLKFSDDLIKKFNIAFNLTCEVKHQSNTHRKFYVEAKIAHDSLRMLSKSIDEFIEALEDIGFSASKDSDFGVVISKNITLSREEEMYYHLHLDNVWRANRYNFFEVQLPIWFGRIVCFFLFISILSYFIFDTNNLNEIIESVISYLRHELYQLSN